MDEERTTKEEARRAYAVAEALRRLDSLDRLEEAVEAGVTEEVAKALVRLNRAGYIAMMDYAVNRYDLDLAVSKLATKAELKAGLRRQTAFIGLGFAALGVLIAYFGLVG